MTNNNYTVIFSSDPWLLARLSTDLMWPDEGIKARKGWNNWVLDGEHDFYHCLWIQIGRDVGFCYHNHDNINCKFKITLTASNYLTTLSVILKSVEK